MIPIQLNAHLYNTTPSKADPPGTKEVYQEGTAPDVTSFLHQQLNLYNQLAKSKSN